MTPTLTSDIAQFCQTFQLREQLRNRHFLITGASGLIGSTLVRCLMALNQSFQLGLKLTCPVRDIAKATAQLHLNDETICLLPYDLSQNDLHHFPQQVDYIVHLASPTTSKYFIEHPVETFRSIVEGTTNLLEYARQTKTERFLYASSMEMYGTILNDSQSLTEDVQGYINPLAARSSYSMGKRAAECLCYNYFNEYHIPVSIARLAQTFGAGVSSSDHRVYAQFARCAISNQDIVLHTRGTLSHPYCYTTDAVSALLYILLRGEAGRAYNVANPDTYISIRDMALLVRGSFAPKIKVKIEMEEGHGYSPTTKHRLDTSEIEKIGWKPQYGLSDMFLRLISHLRQSENTLNQI